MIRISDAAAKLRARMAGKSEDEGFTLIELLVVVIIIGILAAIAIPVYIGVQNNAKDAAVKSDLENAKTAVVAHFTSNNGAYVAIQGSPSPLASDGYPGPSITYTTTAQSPNYKGGTIPGLNVSTFCIEATSPTTNPFHVSESGGVVTGLCP